MNNGKFALNDTSYYKTMVAKNVAIIAENEEAFLLLPNGSFCPHIGDGKRIKRKHKKETLCVFDLSKKQIRKFAVNQTCQREVSFSCYGTMRFTIFLPRRFMRFVKEAIQKNISVEDYVSIILQNELREAISGRIKAEGKLLKEVLFRELKYKLIQYGILIEDVEISRLNIKCRGDGANEACSSK